MKKDSLTDYRKSDTDWEKTRQENRSTNQSLETLAFLFVMLTAGVLMIYMVVSGVHSIGNKLAQSQADLREISKDHINIMQRIIDKEFFIMSKTYKDYRARLDGDYGCIMTCGKR